MSEIIKCGQVLCGEVLCGEANEAINEEMFENFSNKPILTYSVDASNAIVNLKSGMYKVETTDISFGSGPMAISFSHIYNSKMKSDVVYKANNKWIRTYMGNGFKLNLQQYLIPAANGGYEYGTDQIKYHYIDGSGTRHNMVQNGSVLYDTSGLGLILEEMSGNSGHYGTYYGASDERNAVRKLTDRQGNMLFFDKHGRLAATGSVFYSANKFEYAGSTAKLTSVTTASLTTANAAQTERTAMFFYNAADMLDRIEYGTYSGGTFKSQDNPAVYFEYDFNTRSLKKIYKSILVSGKLESRLIAELSISNGFLYKVRDDAEQALVFDFLDGQISKVTEGGHTNPGIFQMRRSDSIDYVSDLQTKVTGNNGVCIVYNMNNKGEMYSVIEENANNIFTPVYPEMNTDGVKVSKFANGDTSNVFNAYKTGTVKSAATFDVVGSAYVKTKDEIINDMKASGRQIVGLSGWIKINSMKINNISLTIDSKTITAEVDNSLKDWQYFCTEDSISFVLDNLKDVKIKVNSADANWSSPNYCLSDIRIAPPQKPFEFLGGTTFMPLKQVTKIVINDNVNVNPKSENCAFTAQDMLQTLQNLALSTNGKFNFVYNKGKRLMAQIGSLAFITDGIGLPYKFAANSNVSSRHENQILSTAWTTTENAIQYVSNGKEMLMKSVISVINHNYNNGNPIIKESSETAFYNLKGQLIEKTDSNGIKRNYEYDIFGNLTKTTITEPKKGEKMVFESKFSANGEHLKSEVRKLGDIDRTEDYLYFDPSSAVEKITDPKGQDVNYQYDKFYDRLESIYTVVDDLKNQNSFGYDSRGRAHTFHNGCSYDFGYNNFNQMTLFSTDNLGIVYKTYGFDSVNKRHYTETTYYNDHIKRTDYSDKYGRFIEHQESSSVKLKDIYCDERNDFYADGQRATSAAKLRIRKDNITGIEYKYNYGSQDQLEGYQYKDNYDFSLNQRALSQYEQEGADEKFDTVYQRREAYGYDSKTKYDNNTIQPRITNTRTEGLDFQATRRWDKKFDYDGFGRVKNIESTAVFKSSSTDTVTKSSQQFIYCTNNDGNASPYLEQHAYCNANGDREKVFNFMYDANGNIRLIEDNDLINKKYGQKTYGYDKLNRLTVETEEEYDGTFTRSNYKYDAGGNRTQKTKNGQIEVIEDISYHYSTGWRDQLMRIETTKNGTKSIRYFSYDTCGNPTRYKTSSQTADENMTWTRGRMLSKYNDTEFKYNALGLRTEKSTIKSYTTNERRIKKYYWDGNKIIGEDWSDGLRLRYTYDTIGIASMEMFYGNNALVHTYTYVLNALGDVVQIIDEKGKTVGRYSYDAFGKRKVISDSIVTWPNGDSVMSEVNPFYYRGYYYDTDTWLYYLQSRYYDPDTGRFINADDISYANPENINGLNLYIYCYNNPVMMTDSTGKAPEWLKALGAAVLIAVGVAAIMFISATTLGLGGVAIGAMGMGMAFGAIKGTANAISEGTSIWGGMFSGALKGFGLGAGLALGIMTGGGAFGLLGGIAAFASAVAINQACGMGAYAIDNMSNNRGTTFAEAWKAGNKQALKGAAAFAAGMLLGKTLAAAGVPKAAMFSTRWYANVITKQIVKGVIYYPLMWLIDTIFD